MRTIIFLCCSLLTAAAWAHGAIHDQLQGVETQLKEDPENVELYLKRGRLYMEARRYHDAEHAFLHALEIDPTTARSAHYFLGRVLLLSNELPEAERHARKFVAVLNHEQGALARGYRLLGDILLARQQPLKAAKAYQIALSYNDAPRPVHYREYAAAYLAAGEKYRGAALKVLDDGISRLGPLVTLQEMAVEIELQDGNYSAALQRLDVMIAQGQRLAALYQQKGDVLLQTKQSAEAKVAYQSALDAVKALPVGRQKTEAMSRLQRDIQQKLQSL